jgi:DNA-binding response OmpR family regulator
MKVKAFHIVVTDWELRVRKIRPAGDAPAPGTDKDVLPLNGAEFVKRLRQSRFSPNPFVSVIMLLNEESEECMSQARDAGVNEVIVQPLKAGDLCQRIVGLVDHQRYFITAEAYKGPCRRRQQKLLGPHETERRVKQIRLVRRKEFKTAS